MPRIAAKWPTCSASTKPRIPREASWPYHQILEGILRGEIRGLWVIATNPAHSWINQGTARDILDRLDFLVVQDMYHTTETAQLADLVLPAAGWGEKEGTFINSERRIGLVQQSRPRAGRGARRFSHLQAGRRVLGLRRDVSRMGVARGRVSIAQAAQRRPAVRHHRHRRLRDARRARRHPMALPGRLPRSPTKSGGSSRTASSITPTAARDSSAKRRVRCPSSRIKSTRSCCSPAAARPPSGTRKLAPQSRPSCASSIPQELYVEINPQDAARLDIRSGDLVDVSLAARPACAAARSSRRPFNRDKCSSQCTTATRIC